MVDTLNEVQTKIRESTSKKKKKIKKCMAKRRHRKTKFLFVKFCLLLSKLIFLFCYEDVFSFEVNQRNKQKCVWLIDKIPFFVHSKSSMLFFKLQEANQNKKTTHCWCNWNFPRKKKLQIIWIVRIKKKSKKKKTKIFSC